LRRDFLLQHGTRRDRIKLLGNGVCPPVMKAVLEAAIGACVARPRILGERSSARAATA